MRIINRPLLVCAAGVVASFAVGYLCGGYSVFCAIAAVVLSALSLAFGFIVKNKSARRALTLLCAASLCSACSFACVYFYYCKGNEKLSVYFEKEEINVTASVESVSYKSSYLYEYVIKTCDIDGEDVSVKIAFSEGEGVLRRGDVFSATLTLEPLSEKDGAYLLSQGIRAEATVCPDTKITLVGEKAASLGGFIIDVRNFVIGRIDRMLDERSAAFYKAIFTGDKSGIADIDELNVRRSGASHLLAVSGMHFSIVMGAAAWLLAQTAMPIKLRSAVLLVCSFCFAAFTGFSASVIRSMIMLSVVYVGGIVGKNRDPLTSLALAASVMLFAFPNLLLDVSFWLSFSATLGILLIFPVVSKLFDHIHKSELSDILRDEDHSLPERVKRYLVAYSVQIARALPSAIVSSLLASLAALLFSMPFTLLFFGSVSYTSVVSTLVLTPLLSVGLILAPFALAFGNLPLLNALFRFVPYAFYTVCETLSDLGAVYVNVNYTAVYVVTIAFLAGVALMLAFSADSKKTVALILSFTVVLPLTGYVSEKTEYGGFEVSCTSHSDSDGMSIRTDDGMIVADMGAKSVSDARSMLSSAETLRENEISAYIVTTVNDHSSVALGYVLSHFRVDTVWLPHYENERYRTACEMAEKKALRLGCEVRYFGFGNEFTISDVTVLVSELEFTDAQAPPSYSVSFTRDEHSALWVSCSYFEGKKSESLGGDGYELVFFGSYGKAPSKNVIRDARRLCTDTMLVLDAEKYDGKLDSMFEVSSKYVKCVSENQTWRFSLAK